MVSSDSCALAASTSVLPHRCLQGFVAAIHEPTDHLTRLCALLLRRNSASIGFDIFIENLYGKIYIHNILKSTLYVVFNNSQKVAMSSGFLVALTFVPARRCRR